MTRDDAPTATRVRQRKPSEWATCQRCGVRRMINRSRPAPLCRDCTPPHPIPQVPCERCGRVMPHGSLVQHQAGPRCIPGAS